MLFSEVKDRSLSVLKIVMALFIVIAPSLFGVLNTELSACILFLLTGTLFSLRMNKTEQNCVSICQLVLSALLFYSVISVFGVSNRNGHYTYILTVAAAVMFFSLVTDYFCESNDEKLQRRMMYMFSAGGFICALWNILYWIICLVPYGKNESFSQGLGSCHFLAVFMLLCIILTYRLIKDNSRLRKVMLGADILIMLFVFIMAKSTVGWVLSAVSLLLYYSTRRTKKFFVPMTLCAAVLFFVFTAVWGSGTGYGVIFKDVFSYGISNLFGKGGGFWSAREMFLSGNYPNASLPGLISSLCAASGLVGVICCAVITGRAVMQFIKLKSWASAANVFVTVMVMLLPFAESLIPLFLWIGLTAYNEKDADFVIRRNLNKKTVKYVNVIISAATVLTVVVLFQTCIKMSAYKKYTDGSYEAAYELYTTAASVNPADGESCRMAAKALYKSGSVKERYTEAIALIEKAQKRDRYNLENMQVKAQIYYACGMYYRSAQEYELIASKVKVNDNYNLETVKSLYNIICTKEKGSADAKSVYEKMTVIAEKTEDLDYKEQINNIVDKALVYTKGELNVEEKR